MFYQSRNPLAACSPLRSCQWGKPAYLVLGVTEQFKAESALAQAQTYMPIYEQRLAAACEALGFANQVRGPQRKRHQANALRNINAARAQLRAGRKALVAAQLAMAAFTTAPALALAA
jgi:hypothetical protein